MKKERIYTDEQIDGAIGIIRNRVKELVDILGKRANVLSYIISPSYTAIGSSINGNYDVFEKALYENVVVRCNKEHWECDGTRGYTLIDIANMIKNEEL